jgi:hypothetical protein
MRRPRLCLTICQFPKVTGPLAHAPPVRCSSSRCSPVPPLGESASRCSPVHDSLGVSERPAGHDSRSSPAALLARGSEDSERCRAATVRERPLAHARGSEDSERCRPATVRERPLTDVRGSEDPERCRAATVREPVLERAPRVCACFLPSTRLAQVLFWPRIVKKSSIYTLKWR